MWINRIAWLFNGEREIVLLSIIVLGIFLLAFLVGCCCGNVDIFLGTSFLALGISCALINYYKYTVVANVFFFFFIAIAGGLYLLLCLALFVKKRRKERKKRRQELTRKIVFSLPEKDNSYIRDRLHTALQIPQREDDFSCRQAQMGLRFGFAKELAEKLKTETISAIERAEVDEMLRMLSSCEGKNEWSGKEIRMVNDIFMRLLKLSAKYEIAI